MFQLHDTVIRDMIFADKSWPFTRSFNPKHTLLTLSSHGCLKVSSSDNTQLNSFDFSHGANSIVCTPEPYGSCSSYDFSSALVTGGTVIASFVPDDKQFNCTANNSVNTSRSATPNGISQSFQGFEQMIPLSQQQVPVNHLWNNPPSIHSSRPSQSFHQVYIPSQQASNSSISSNSASVVQASSTSQPSSLYFQLVNTPRNSSTINIYIPSVYANPTGVANPQAANDPGVNANSRYNQNLRTQQLQNSLNQRAQSANLSLRSLSMIRRSLTLQRFLSPSQPRADPFLGHLDALPLVNNGENNTDSTSDSDDDDSQMDFSNEHLSNDYRFPNDLGIEPKSFHIKYHYRWDENTLNADEPGGKISRLRFSSNGAFLYAAGDGGLVKKYVRLPNSGFKCLQEVQLHKSDVYDMDISNNDEC